MNAKIRFFYPIQLFTRKRDQCSMYLFCQFSFKLLFNNKRLFHYRWSSLFKWTKIRYLALSISCETYWFKWKIFCSEMKRKVKISVKEGRKIAVIGLRVIPSPATVLHWFLFPRVFWILSFNWLPLSNFLERRRILIIYFHHVHLDSQFLFIHKTFHTVNSLECLGLRGTWDGPDHLLN